MRGDIVIYLDDEGYEVWCGVEEGNNVVDAHVIGFGSTRDAAVRMAVEHLEGSLEELQSQPGVLAEVDVRSQVVKS